jgi:hypothetical protein
MRARASAVGVWKRVSESSEVLVQYGLYLGIGAGGTSDYIRSAVWGVVQQLGGRAGSNSGIFMLYLTPSAHGYFCSCSECRTQCSLV